MRAVRPCATAYNYDNISYNTTLFFLVTLSFISFIVNAILFLKLILNHLINIF